MAAGGENSQLRRRVCSDARTLSEALQVRKLRPREEAPNNILGKWCLVHSLLRKKREAWRVSALFILVENCKQLHATHQEVTAHSNSGTALSYNQMLQWGTQLMLASCPVGHYSSGCGWPTHVSCGLITVVPNRLISNGQHLHP